MGRRRRRRRARRGSYRFDGRRIWYGPHVNSGRRDMGDGGRGGAWRGGQMGFRAMSMREL